MMVEEEGEGRQDSSEQILKEPKKARREKCCTAKERISKMPPCIAGKRSSIYRGVTRHRWTGRYEAHLWDKTTWNQAQNKKGKQVYLGAYDDEQAAARAYDLAALKYWGPGTLINFPVSDYSRDIEDMQMVSREDYLATLRRKSSSFSRGLSKYRRNSRAPQSIRWETSFHKLLGEEYFNSLNYSSTENSASESELLGGFCLEKKIDITSYIQWWASKDINPSNSLGNFSQGTCDIAEDVGSEMKTLVWSVQHTEPYQLPSLGLPQMKKSISFGLSACDILSQSAAFTHLQKMIPETNEDERILRLIGNSEAQKTPLHLCEVPIQNSRHIAPVETTSLLTSCPTTDNSLPDSTFWTNLIVPKSLFVSNTFFGEKQLEEQLEPEK